MITRLSLLGALTAALLYPQRFELGLRAGVPILRPYLRLSPGFDGVEEGAARYPTVGISARVGLPAGVAIRLMPAWQHVRFDYNTADRFGTVSQATTANRWEVPVVLEWRLHEHIRPGLGGTVSMVSNEKSWTTVVSNPGFGSPDGYTNRFRTPQLSRTRAVGFIGDVSFPYRTRFGTAAPDVRYTRWASKHFGYRGRLNEFTAGLSFRW